MITPVEPNPSTPVTLSERVGKDNQAFIRELAISISLVRAIDHVVQSLKKTKHLFQNEQS